MINTPTRVTPRLEYEGFAAEDLKENSTVLEVICPELLPNSASGTLGAGITKGTLTLTDRDGNPININVTSANHIVATWGGASNQRTPPLVKKGEPVKLYKVANQDKFFWSASGSGRDFRKIDRVQFEVAAIGDKSSSQEKSDNNTYTAYLDSVNKKVGIKTSQDNGEVTAFVLEADMAEGTFYLSDNNSKTANRIFLDTGAKSGTPIIQLNLSSGTTLKMQGDDVFIKVPKKLIIDAGDRIIINSPLTIFNLNKAGAIIMNASSIAMNAAKDFVTTAATVGLNGATKVGGVLVASAARIATLVKGPAGGNYNGATIARPEDTPVSTPSNSPDTSMSGPPYLS